MEDMCFKTTSKESQHMHNSMIEILAMYILPFRSNIHFCTGLNINFSKKACKNNNSEFSNQFYELREGFQKKFFFTKFVATFIGDIYKEKKLTNEHFPSFWTRKREKAACAATKAK